MLMSAAPPSTPNSSACAPAVSSGARTAEAPASMAGSGGDASVAALWFGPEILLLLLGLLLLRVRPQLLLHLRWVLLLRRLSRHHPRRRWQALQQRRRSLGLPPPRHRQRRSCRRSRSLAQARRRARCRCSPPLHHRLLAGWQGCIACAPQSLELLNGPPCQGDFNKGH